MGSFSRHRREAGHVAAVDMFNQAGGLNGRPIELYLEDDQSNPTAATTAATKLSSGTRRSRHHRCEHQSSRAWPSFPPASGAAYGYAHAPLHIPLKKWVFLVPLDDFGLSDKMVDFAVNELGKKKLAIIRDTSPYGKRGSRRCQGPCTQVRGDRDSGRNMRDKDTDMTPR